MEREEKVIKLMSKTGADRADVEAALNACNDDILDAALYLEALGKVKPMVGQAASAGTQNAAGQNEQYNQSNQSTGHAQSKGESFAAGVGKVLRTIGNWIDKGLKNYLDIYRDGNCVMSIPLTILVLLFIPFFWLMTVALIVFLFFGFRYEFRGPNCKKDSKVNQVLNQASDTCNNMKEEFKRGYNGDNNDTNN